MKASVEWKGGLAFTGLGASGIPLQIDSSTSADGQSIGLRPTELVLLGLASCMAMDVISSLGKKTPGNYLLSSKCGCTAFCRSPTGIYQ